jgi:ADP-heptose:LPS heptosyltransferase
MLLPTIEAWASKEPDTNIVVVMDKPASAVLERKGYTIINHEDFDITEYNDANFFNVSHCCLDYEAKRKVLKSRFALFAEQCDIAVDKCGSINITDTEVQHIFDRVPLLKKKFHGYKVVGIVKKTQQKFRNYPHIHLIWEYFNRTPLIDHTIKKIIPVVIDHEDTIDGILTTSDLDIRETIVLISQLDLVIGPDTGMLHVAGSLGIPTIWIFGPIDPKLRIGYYSNAQHFWRPCNKDRACWYDYCSTLNCLWKISPWTVVRLAKRLLK